MATFPAYAIALFTGEPVKPDPGVKRSDMEVGPPKQLQTASRVLVRRQAAYLLTSKTDKDAWDTWFHATVHHGADWFTWTDPYDAATKQARIVGGDVTPKPLRKALDRWRVEFVLETWSA